MLNLVEGTAAVAKSPSGSFAPFVVHYAETFVVPAACGPYTLEPVQPDEQIVVLKAYVRN